MRQLTHVVLVSAVAFSACQEAPLGPSPDRDASLAALRGQEQKIDVIVVLDPAFAPGGHAANRSRAADVARGLGVAPTFTYGTALYGFAGSIPKGRLRALQNDPKVLYVERDGIASIPNPQPSGLCERKPSHPKCQSPGGGNDPPPGPDTQTTPWGITRVGGPADGTGKTVWIIDTGIDLDHPDLNVDVGRSKNFVFSGRGKKANSPEDGNGHGTHVAGTVAAIDNTFDVVGVAAGATVVAVRVLGNSGSGTISGVAAGVDYVAANAASGDVANMSLTAVGHFQSLHDAVLNAATANGERVGIKFALAAGNYGVDAETREPAHVEHNDVYTVSAIDGADCLAGWSNWGPPVDYAAPGVGVLSTKMGGGTTTFSGTSMAAPHVAGILLLGPVKSDGTVSDICDPDGKPDPIAHY